MLKLGIDLEKTGLSFVDSEIEKLENYPMGKIVSDINSRETGPAAIRGIWSSQGSSWVLKSIIPKEYGGNSLCFPELLGSISYLAFVVDKADILLGLMFQLSGIQLPICIVANEDQKKTFLPRLALGKTVAAHCLTEKGGGTDCLSQTQTQFVSLQDGGYLINGEKDYICNAVIADLGLLYGKYNNQLIVGLIDLNQAAVKRSAPHKKLGLDGVLMGRLAFQNATLDEKNILLGKEMGEQVLYISTSYERIIIPAVFLGRMYKVYKLCSQHSGSENQSILGKMQAKIFQSYQLLKLVFNKLNHSLWNRNYISLACLVKTEIVDNYQQVVMLGKEIVSPATPGLWIFLQEELVSSTAAWIYSGPNDVLLSMLKQRSVYD